MAHAPAVCELDGPIIFGPMTSKILKKFIRISSQIYKFADANYSIPRIYEKVILPKKKECDKINKKDNDRKK